VAVAEHVIDRQRLADWDEARDYDAASSYNYLNAELGRLRAAVAGGAVARVEGEAGPVVLRSVAEVLAWARGRYPYATL
jgi:hypothetical protein